MKYISILFFVFAVSHLQGEEVKSPPPSVVGQGDIKFLQSLALEASRMKDSGELKSQERKFSLFAINSSELKNWISDQMIQSISADIANNEKLGVLSYNEDADVKIIMLYQSKENPVLIGKFKQEKGIWSKIEVGKKSVLLDVSQIKSPISDEELAKIYSPEKMKRYPLIVCEQERIQSLKKTKNTSISICKRGEVLPPNFDHFIQENLPAGDKEELLGFISYEENAAKHWLAYTMEVENMKIKLIADFENANGSWKTCNIEESKKSLGIVKNENEKK